MINGSDIGFAIRAIRTEKDITVADTARLAGISEKHLSALEHGRVDNPTIYLVASIAKVLDISLSDLIRQAESNTF